MSLQLGDLCALVADVCEVQSFQPTDDYRSAPLWGSLTAFALKVTLKRRCAVDLSLRELNSFSTIQALAQRLGLY